MSKCSPTNYKRITKNYKNLKIIYPEKHKNIDYSITVIEDEMCRIFSHMLLKKKKNLKNLFMLKLFEWFSNSN